MISKDLTNKVLAWASKVATEAAQLSSRQAREEYLAERRRELVFGARPRVPQRVMPQSWPTPAPVRRAGS